MINRSRLRVEWGWVSRAIGIAGGGISPISIGTGRGTLAIESTQRAPGGHAGATPEQGGHHPEEGRFFHENSDSTIKQHEPPKPSQGALGAAALETGRSPGVRAD